MPSLLASSRAVCHLVGAVLALAAATVAFALSACGDDGSSDAKRAGASGASAASVATPDGLLTWISRHPANAGLAVLPDRGPAALSFGSDRRFPLASTRKVLIVGALTAAGIALSERVPRRAVERFYVPGADSGAHAHAKLDDARPTLRQLVRASIEVSDNASADALLARVGARAVDAWTDKQGLASEDPILPVLGELASWQRDSAWAQRSPADRARRALALARTVSGRAVRLPGLAQQRRLAASSVAGAPAEWAQLMRQIGRRGDPELVAALDWPRRRNKRTAGRFARYLTKGGNLPGIITEASYVRPAAGAGTAVALFLRDLPPAIEQTFLKSFAQQKLIVRLATDPAFLKRARTVLGDG